MRRDERDLRTFMENTILELKNIGYSYHSLHGETVALKNISFGVREGEFVSVVGPSGCGNAMVLKRKPFPRKIPRRQSGAGGL